MLEYNIDDPDVHEVVRFLIQHLPPRVHFLLASRAEPVLDLARLRAQSGLLELRSADLRFTAVEIDGFLNNVMKLDRRPAEG